MNRLDRELYLTRRLPKPDNNDGPTARYMRWLEELDARVIHLPIAGEQLPLDIDEVVA